MTLLGTFVMVAMASGPTKVMDLKLERERVFEQGEEPYCKLTCDVELFSAKLDSIALYWVKDTGESIQLAKVAESGGTGSFSVEGISGNADLDKITVDKLDTAICDSSYFLCEAVAEKPDAEKERAIATSWPGVQQAGQSPGADTVSALERKLADATALLQMFNMSYQNLMANREKEKQQMEQIIQKLSGSEIEADLSGSSKAECNCDDILSKMDDLYTRMAALEDTDKQSLDETTAVPPTEVLTTSITPSMECKKEMDEEIIDPYVSRNQETIGKEVLCDVQTDGGGWIVIQRRSKGDVDFKKSWNEYREGFGDFTGDFWLGLDAIHKLTSEFSYQLRIDMRTTESEQLYAQFNQFKVAGEDKSYFLTVGDYEGTSGDRDPYGMKYHNNLPFTTFDRDNDGMPGNNCAEMLKGGWWYKSCTAVNINGPWRDAYGASDVIYNIGPETLRLSYVEMKIRRF